MTTKIQSKKQKVVTAWQEYMTADEKAQNNRDLVRGARAGIFRDFTANNKRGIARKYLVLLAAEELQHALDEETMRLGKRFDDLGDELAALQVAAR